MATKDDLSHPINAVQELGVYFAVLDGHGGTQASGNVVADGAMRSLHAQPATTSVPGGRYGKGKASEVAWKGGMDGVKE